MATGTYDYIIRKQSPDISQLNPTAPDYQSRLSDALSWINYVYTPRELKGFTINYLRDQKIDIPGIEDVDDWRFTGTGKHSYILLNQGQLSQHSKDFFQTNLDRIKTEASRLVLEKSLRVKKEVSPEFVQRNLITNVVQQIEDLILNRTYRKDDAQVVEIIRESTINRSGVNEVIQTLVQLRKEVTDTSDPDYAENIQLMGERAVYTADCLENALRQLGMEAANKAVKTSRKPKTIKEQAAVKVTKNVKHKRIDTEHNVVSIDPSQIIGATSLLVFNSKSNRVGLYVAQDGTTLDVKGTTIQNYDEKLSICKTLRRVETDLIAFRNATVPKRIEVLLKTNIRGKEFAMNGRINKDTLLLKVFK